MIFLAGGVVDAQPFYEVVETPRLLGHARENSYTINITGADVGTVEKTWSDLMLRYGGIPEKMAGGSVMAFTNVHIPAISELPLEVFSMAEDPSAISTHFTIWLHEEERFMSSTAAPGSFHQIARLLLRFNLDVEDQVSANTRAEEERISEEAFPSTGIKN